MNSGPVEFRVEYDNAVQEAFSFLVNEFGYVTKPTVFAEKRDQSTITTFTNGDRRIEFRQCLDSAYVTDLLFFPDDVASQAASDQSLVFIDYRRFSIHRALTKLGHPGIPNSDEGINTLAGIYGEACRNLLTGPVSGDFSLFGESVFIVEQVERRNASQRLIRGVFSNLRDSEEFSRKALKSLPSSADVRMEVSVREMDLGE